MLMDEKIDLIISRTCDKILGATPSDITSQSILTGKIGLAHACFHLYKINRDERYLYKITEVLDDVFDSIFKGNSPLLDKISLVDGLPGLGLILHQLSKEKLINDSDIQSIEGLTAAVYKKCISEILKQNFDYFYGSIGLLFYLIEIEAYNEVDSLICVIYDYAINHDFLFYNQVDDPYCQGLNFGFAHGTFAILAVLMKAYSVGIQPEKSHEIIVKTLDNLLLYSRKNVDYNKVTIMHKGWDYPSYFPYNVTTKAKGAVVPDSINTLYHFTDRLGWCNSDLSRMYLLYKIGLTFNIQRYIDIANEISEEVVLRRDIKDTAISDCHMCHGTSGVAYVYKKIFDISNNPVFYEAYQFWIMKTVCYMEQELIKSSSDEDLELLTGWLGPFFVLSESNGKSYDGWDYLFLLSL